MEDNTSMQQPGPTGNDISYGDARDEGRMDKDEDLKDGDDNTSPLAESYGEKKHKMTPGSLATHNPNNGHSDGNQAEADERDPTSQDAPDSPINR